MITPEDLKDKLFALMRNGDLIDNTHRGEVAELIVLEALGNRYEHAGGWGYADIVSGPVTIQVKQAAKRQVWGPSKTLSYNIKKQKQYFEEDNLTVVLDTPERLCNVYIFAMHNNPEIDANHWDASQWVFCAVPTNALNEKFGDQKTVSFNVLQRYFEWVDYDNLAATVTTLRACFCSDPTQPPKTC
ncbi:hypothetical protein [Roseibium sp.]|uniref:hypothetical protein n=1 Tax=Roseibium sp. TaxID=1936156 RepID=UPI003B527A73